MQLIFYLIYQWTKRRKKFKLQNQNQLYRANLSKTSIILSCLRRKSLQTDLLSSYDDDDDDDDTYMIIEIFFLNFSETSPV